MQSFGFLFHTSLGQHRRIDIQQSKHGSSAQNPGTCAQQFGKRILESPNLAIGTASEPWWIEHQRVVLMPASRLAPDEGQRVFHNQTDRACAKA